MPRHFVEIAYKGTAYAGWQRQPNALTVQEVIESKLSVVLRHDVSIVGCGRTDTGVHASQYFFHFDTEVELPRDLSHRLNRMLPSDIAIRRIFEVSSTDHARFNATERSYGYYIVGQKSPFNFETKTYVPRFKALDKAQLVACGELIKSYDAFYPFCKSRSDAETMNCTIMRSEWSFSETEYKYTIAANRFLRGMVRLIVGISLRAALGEVTIDEIENALQQQTRLSKSWSAPAEGLFLESISYDIPNA